MKQSEESTIEYYNKNARTFTQETVNSDMTNIYTQFFKYLKPGQKILDLGCGSGRDSKNFLEKGFDVVSIDGSLEVCKVASKYIGQEVWCKRFEELTYTNEFDGIWACASLLHVKEEALPNILHILSKALKKNGYLYASFKYGRVERINSERIFNDYTENDVDKIFNKKNGFKCLHYTITEDVRINRNDEKWLNIIAQKSEIVL